MRKKQENKKKFLRKQTEMLARATPMDVLLWWSCQTALYTVASVKALCPGEKIDKKFGQKTKKREKAMSETSKGQRRVPGDPQLKWEGQRNYILTYSLHKDSNSCFSIRN